MWPAQVSNLHLKTFRSESQPLLVMSSTLAPKCGFHFRRMIQIAPLPLAAMLLTGVLIVFAIGLAAALSQARLDLQIENRMLERQVRAAGTARAIATPTLPQFEDFDSTRLVHALNRLADQAQVPLTEINYALDDGANLPYVRYRATLKVTAGYVPVRAFIDSVRSGLRDVALDAISCTRDNAKAAKLNCELGFSAFYRKGSGG